MYEVGVVEHFEAAHALKGDFGPATRTHGHRYRVEVVVKGETLREDGTLCDIGMLGEALRNAIGDLHYRDLNALPAFAGINTTAENVAGYFAELLRPELPSAGLASLTVKVWESPGAFAAVETPLARQG